MTDLLDAIQGEIRHHEDALGMLQEMLGMAERLNGYAEGQADGSSSPTPMWVPKPEPTPEPDPMVARRHPETPHDQNGSLEGKVLEALAYDGPHTKGVLAARFEVEPRMIEKVLAKLRGEGEVEPGHSRQGWRRV